MIPENIYGSLKRLQWMHAQIPRGGTVADLGCGTGVMLTLPLARMGVDIVGYDVDPRSIEYGRALLKAEGLDENRLRAGSVDNVANAVDVVIASEVLEHLPDPDVSRLLGAIRDKLRPQGVLLITVPNGYGWFEWESFAWRYLGLRFLFGPTRLGAAMCAFKRVLFGPDYEVNHVATLGTSPHVQRFTRESIRRTLMNNGFQVEAIEGSVLACGPLTNLLFTGFKPVMAFNNWLGTKFPGLAAGMYVRARAVP